MPLPLTPYQLLPLPLPFYAPYPFSIAPSYGQAGLYGRGTKPFDWAKEPQSESRPSLSGSVAVLYSLPTDPLVLLS